MKLTDGKKIIHVKNGTPKLAEITGTGCMLGVLCGCYLSVFNNIDSVVTACAVLGICGEYSVTENGNGSFMVKLMDNISVLTTKNISEKLKMEVKEIEKA